MTAQSKRLVLGLAGFQIGDAAFNAVGLYDIAETTWWGRWVKEWTKDDLDHLGFPERFRFVFPIIKSGSAAGLLIGLRWRRVGRFTAAALVVYFLTALGFHARARDGLTRTSPAVVMLLWSGLAVRVLGTSSR